MTSVRPAGRGLWIFAAAMSSSLVIAAFAGLVLGIVAATNSDVTGERWSEIVQAHGDLQLWGWFAVFTAALGLEFIVRLNRRTPAPAMWRLLILGLLTSGAIVAAAGRALGYFAQPLAVGGAVLILGGASGFAAVILRVPAMRPLRVDLHPLFFRAGASWMLIAAAMTLVSAMHMTSGVVSIGESRATADLFLRGFLTNIIIAVALRAFPGHLELAPTGIRLQRVLFMLLNGGLVLWAMGVTGFGLPGVEVLQRLGDVAFAATILFATVVLGIGGAVPGWSHAAERVQIMIPVAWLGLLAYALALLLQQATAALGHASPTFFESGAVRHLFMFGFIAPLMVAMAHVVLRAFGVGRVLGENWLTAAFVVLMVAWPLRVVPPLIDPELGDAARGLMGTAGLLAIVALAMAAGVAARNAIAIRQQLH